jgi:hypothetical protein
MADVVINTKVEAPDVSSLSAIKKELKEMKSLALNGDGVAAKRVAELTDKLEDLKDETKSLKGSGIEKLTGSFSLLTDGFKNFDTDKLKLGFKGLGNAMSAVPIFFLIEGLRLLVDSFPAVYDAFKNFFDLTSDGEKKVKALNKELESTKAINEATGAALSNEIKLMEAQGKSQDEILAKRKELNAVKIKELEIDIQLQKAKIEEIITNDSIIESLYRKAAAIQRAAGNDKAADAIEQSILKDKLARAKEQTDLIRKDLITIATLKNDIAVEEVKVENNKNAQLKTAYDKAKADRLKEIEDSQKLFDQVVAEESKRQDILDKQDAEAREKLKQERLKNLEELKALQLKADQEETANKIAEWEKQEAYNKQYKERQGQIEQNYFSAAQGLSEAFFAFQLGAAEGNEEAQLEIKKRAFQVDKAFRVAQATMDGIGSVTKTLAAGGVLALPLAISMGVLAVANVAKILATKFNGGKAGSAGSIKPQISVGSNSNNSNPSQKQLPQNQASNPQGTNFDANGNKIDNTVTISVEEINDVQKRVAKVKEQRKF